MAHVFETYYLLEEEEATIDQPGGWWIMAEGERPPSSACPGPYVRKCGWYETHSEAQQELMDLRARGEKIR